MSSRGLPVTQQRREERRKQAEARQAAYDQLTLQQKLDRLPVGGSNRQRVRLETELSNNQQNKKKEGK